MKSFSRLIFLVLVTCSLMFKSALAQTTSGQISGRVVDPDGRSIVNAEVTLTNQLNAEKRMEKTDTSGDFVFASVQPGTYMLSVTAQGFKVFTKKDLVLTASERLSAGNMRLETGAITQSVEVTADATPVHTESGERSALLDDHQLATLLDPARNFMNLTRVLPGVVAANTVGQDQLGIYGIDVVNGVRTEYSTVSVDGVDANTNARGVDRVETPLNTDAIAEVKILQNNYQAEYGGSSGAVINTVTKSGTRAYHGTAYYYKRHEQFNAHDFFDSAYWNGGTAQPKAINRFNTIGYNLGGPVWIPGVNFNRNKDKLFFFFSQEIWPTVHPGDGTPLKLRMPTALERQGDFSQSLNNSGKPITLKDPKNCGAAGAANCLLNPTHINPAYINADMQKLLNILPLPTLNGLDSSGANFILPLTEKNPVDQKVLRVDYNMSDKWRAYFRGVDMTVKSEGNAAAFIPMSYLTNFPVNYDNRAPNLTVNVTYLASPTLINEFNLGWAAWSEDQVFPNGSGELATVQKSALGITLGQFRPQENPRGLIPVLTFGGGGLSKLPTIGFSGSNGSRFPIHSQSSSYGLTDGLTKIWQGHIFKAGIYAHTDRYVQLHVAGNFAGNYNFSVNTANQFDSGNTYSNALLGNFLQYAESTGAPDSDPFTHIFDWYVQDNWKILKNFTLDYGLRFTWDIPQSLHRGGDFLPALYDFSQRAVLYTPARIGNQNFIIDPRNPAVRVGSQLSGAVVPGSGNLFDGLLPISNTNIIGSRGVLVAPRIGFAWDIFGDGKTALRGGFGVFYNSRPPSAQAGDLTNNPPVQSNPTRPFGNASQLFTGVDSSVVFPSSLSRSLPQSAQRPVVYNYSLGIERNIGFQTVLDVSYVGNEARHLGEIVDLNALPPGTRFLSSSVDPTSSSGKPLPDNFLRRYIGFGSIPFTVFEGTSNYNALQIQATHRFSRGLSFGVNYTWSKTLDYTDSTTGTVAAFAPIHAYNYGLASFDRDHAFKVNWLWNIPKASRLLDNGVIRAAFDNWQLSGIAYFIRGAPQGITLNTGGVDLTGGTDGPRALLTGNPILSPGDRTTLRYLNTAVVFEPPVNTRGSNGQYSNFVGNAGKAVFRGPGINNWDMALFKNIPIKERATLQLRGEFYNIFNHHSFTAVDNTLEDSNFGQVTADRGQRQIQLAARISF